MSGVSEHPNPPPLDTSLISNHQNNQDCDYLKNFKPKVLLRLVLSPKEYYVQKLWYLVYLQRFTQNLAHMANVDPFIFGDLSYLANSPVSTIDLRTKFGFDGPNQKNF